MFYRFKMDEIITVYLTQLDENDTEKLQAKTLMNIKTPLSSVIKFLISEYEDQKQKNNFPK